MGGTNWHTPRQLSALQVSHSPTCPTSAPTNPSILFPCICGGDVVSYAPFRHRVDGGEIERYFEKID